MRSTLLSLLLLLGFSATAQLPFDMKDPGDRLVQRCQECLSVLQHKPKEVQFGLFADPAGDVYFLITDKRFFDQLFNKSGDGVAVDVVPRSLYACDAETKPQTTYFKGRVLEPTYLSAMKKDQRTAPDGSVVMKVGHLPPDLIGKPVELNLVVLKDRYVCYYNWFYNLQAYRWDLLDMGLYLDSLRYHEPVDTLRMDSTLRFRHDRSLQFIIPFEKNKSEYSAKDLAPMRDSLRLTDFTITAIDIHAFSSVEGPEKRNIELQEKRAASIVGSLQSFQSPGIRTTVKASENWVEFLNDIGGTTHRDLIDLPKEKVKEKLQDKNVAEALEPILSKHRKALVTVYLEKSGTVTKSTEQLVQELERAITDNNLKRATEIQALMFERIADNEAPASLLDRVEIPRKKEFALLLNQRAGFKYFSDPEAAFSTYLELQALDKLVPDNPHIKYNLCAVKFRVWVGGQQAVEPKEFLKEINALRNYRIEEALVKRMLVNHRILMAELHMRQGMYAEKDQDLKYITQNYRSVKLSDRDQLSLAQYFVSFGNYEEARKVIEPHLARIDISKDLLFYYLNLTLTDEPLTKKPEYRRTMLNAINADRRRFCNLFEPFGLGITFQLLENPYLKKTYCENCY